jgi:hypothetical protein
MNLHQRVESLHLKRPQTAERGHVELHAPGSEHNVLKAVARGSTLAPQSDLTAWRDNERCGAW